MQVVPFTPRAPGQTQEDYERQQIEAAREEIVELLTELLGEAREGKYSAVAVAYARPDGFIGAVFTSGPGGPLLGAATLLQHRIIHTLDDDDG